MSEFNDYVPVLIALVVAGPFTPSFSSPTFGYRKGHDVICFTGDTQMDGFYAEMSCSAQGTIGKLHPGPAMRRT